MIKDCVACLAQLAERKTEDLEVAGSTPAAGSKFFFYFLRNMFYNYGELNIINNLPNEIYDDKLIEIFLVIILLFLLNKYFL